MSTGRRARIRRAQVLSVRRGRASACGCRNPPPARPRRPASASPKGKKPVKPQLGNGAAQPLAGQARHTRWKWKGERWATAASSSRPGRSSPTAIACVQAGEWHQRGGRRRCGYRSFSSAAPGAVRMHRHDACRRHRRAFPILRCSGRGTFPWPRRLDPTSGSPIPLGGLAVHPPPCGWRAPQA